MIAWKTYAQEPGNNLFMNKEQNHDWLTKVKSLGGKKEQWHAIQERFLMQTVESPNQNDRAKDCPVFMIDGVPYEISDLSDVSRQQLRSLITADKIGSIAIIDTEPGQLKTNTPFTGMVLVTLNDRKTKSRLRKLKLV